MRSEIGLMVFVGIFCGSCTTTQQAYKSDTHSPEIVSTLPVGKLAFVTSDNFGSPGTISVLGSSTVPFQGAWPKFTSDGTVIVYSNTDGRRLKSKVYIRDLLKNVSRQIDTRAQNAEDPSLSPDGSKLLFVVWPMDRSNSHIYISEATGSN